MFTRNLIVMTLLVVPAILCAQQTDRANEPPPIPYPPVRIEFGGYGLDYGNGGGWWRGADATLLLRYSRWFIPSFTVDSRTSDAGSSRYYSFFSYANWTANFFTTQAVSGSPGDGPELFPSLRYDVKAWWKVPPRRRLVTGLGFTQFSFRDGSRGQILNPGVMYYAGPVVFDAEGFINRNQPGNFWSGAGLLAVQHGQEGHHWVGITIGGGRQVYRALSTIPLDVRFSSFSVDAFYRQWLSRHFGFVISGGYQDAYHNYQRFGFAGHLFFEF